MKHFRQINAVRGIGVLLVIMFHWILQNGMVSVLSNGALGVDIFFVLSGFFITGLLLDGRKMAGENGISRITVFKNFLLNRALRIFPLYYITIFILYIFHETTNTTIQSNFIYYATYTSNFLLHQRQQWDDIVSHFWSLAVEEQFYLVWPLVILGSPKKYLPFIISFFIAIGFFTQRFWAVNEFDLLLPFTCFDALGMGALLSWIYLTKPHHFKKAYHIISFLLLMCFAYFIVGKVLNKNIFLPDDTMSLLAAWFIAGIILKEHKTGLIFSFFLNSRPLIFIGKISYGVYIFHLILPHYVWKLIHIHNFYDRVPNVLKQYDILFHSVNLGVIILLAWFSYRFIETPILQLKKHLAPSREKKNVSAKEPVLQNAL